MHEEDGDDFETHLDPAEYEHYPVECLGSHVRAGRRGADGAGSASRCSYVLISFDFNSSEIHKQNENWKRKWERERKGERERAILLEIRELLNHSD